MSLDDEITKVAYELFERDGGVHGKDREHWLEAEEIVKARHAAAQVPSGKAKPKASAASAAAGAKKAPSAKKTSSGSTSKKKAKG